MERKRLFFQWRYGKWAELLYAKGWSSKNKIWNGKGKFNVENIELNYKKHYDTVRGEIIKGKLNGFAKIYNKQGVLVFEGEYLNGIKNGFVKEYNENGFLKFEGEYLNGKIYNGTKRKYYNNMNLRTEIQYIKGDINQKIIYNYDNMKELVIKGEKKNVKEYDKFGNLIFEGDYHNNKIWKGQMKKYDSDGKLKLKVNI